MSEFWNDTVSDDVPPPSTVASSVTPTASHQKFFSARRAMLR